MPGAPSSFLFLVVRPGASLVAFPYVSSSPVAPTPAPGSAGQRPPVSRRTASRSEDAQHSFAPRQRLKKKEGALAKSTSNVLKAIKVHHLYILGWEFIPKKHLKAGLEVLDLPGSTFGFHTLGPDLAGPMKH